MNEIMMTSRARNKNRGFTIIEVLIALGVSAIVMSIGVSVVGSAGHGFTRQAFTMKSQSMIDGLDAQMRASANTSIAIYTPNTCGAGNGDGTACNQVRFYGQDKSGGYHAWGWEYDGTSVVRECLAYPTGNDGADASCSNYGQSTNGIKAFVVTPTPVTSLPLAAQFGTPTSQEKKVGGTTFDPNGRVVAGNRVMIVQIGDANVQRDIHMIQGGAPFSASVLKGSFVPPSLGVPATAANVSPFVWFANNTAAGCLGPSGTSISPCTVSVQETNYAQYEPYIPMAQWWTGGACAQGTATWNGNSTPSDTGVFNMAPAASGNCNVVVSSKDNPANVGLAVGGPFTPSVGSVSVSSGGSVNTYPASATFSHQKTSDPFSLTYQYISDNCSGSVTTAGSANGSASGNVSSTATVDQTITAASIPAGTNPMFCVMNLRDQYSESDSINVNVYAALAPGSPSGSAASTTSANLNSSGPSGGTAAGYSVTYHFSGGAVACGPVGYACTINGLAPGTAYTFYATYTDSVGDQANSGIFGVTTLTPPPPTPTPAPTPTPTPTPTPVGALQPGTCNTSNAKATSLDIFCTSPSGGTGISYGSQIHQAGQSPTIICNWATAPGFACTVSGLSPSTTYSASPLFGDSAATHVFGPDFSGTTLAVGATPPPVTPVCSNQPAGTDLGSGYVSTGTRCALNISTFGITLYYPGDGTHPNSASFATEESNNTTGLNVSSNCTANVSPLSFPSHGAYGAQNDNVTVTSTTTAGNCVVTVSDAGGQTQTVNVQILPFGGTPPLIPGVCSTGNATTTSLDVTCTAPSGGTGASYGVQIHGAGQNPTVICNWIGVPGFVCTINGLSPNTTYSASPLFGDSAATHVYGRDFSGTTLAVYNSGRIWYPWEVVSGATQVSNVNSTISSGLSQLPACTGIQPCVGSNGYFCPAPNTLLGCGSAITGDSSQDPYLPGGICDPSGGAQIPAICWKAGSGRPRPTPKPRPAPVFVQIDVTSGDGGATWSLCSVSTPPAGYGRLAYMGLPSGAPQSLIDQQAAASDPPNQSPFACQNGEN